MSSTRNMWSSCCRYLFIVLTSTYLACILRACHAVESDHDTSYDPASCLVWGPGLHSAQVLPARYFFIQTARRNGENMTTSSGDIFNIEMQHSNSGKKLRAYFVIRDQHDGSYSVRYRLFESVEDHDVLLVIKDSQNRHIGKSPYVMQAPLYHEDCDCPENDIEVWLENMGCPSRYRQIESDLKIFHEIDMRKAEQEVIKRFAAHRYSHSVCHYIIKNNQIYRRTFGEHVGFKMFSDAILSSISRKVRLPDMEFFVNLGDWPLEKRAVKDKPIPILSWCGSETSRDIIMPTYEITEATLEMLGRQSMDMISITAHTGPKWENKTDLAFFRGRDSRQERLNVVKLSQRHPDIVDARLTNMFFFRDQMDDMGGTVKHISFYDFFKHKYQINIDGTVAAYRFPYLMAGDSLILKQDSDYYEHFYKDVHPYVHYVPVKADLSNLLQQIQWAKEHLQEAKTIAKNAQKYVRDHLMPVDIFCYHVVLFKEYAKRLKSPIRVQEDMEKLNKEPKQGSGRSASCDCLKYKGKEEL